MRTGSTLLATSLLLAVTVCATSFAVAADTDRLAPPPAPTPVQTPSAYVPVVDPALGPIDATAEDLAWAARDVLGDLQSLDVKATYAAIDRGDAAAATFTSQLANLAADNPAASSAATLPGLWQTVRTRATTVAALLTDLEAHDNAAIRATGYGRQRDWSNALAMLDEATAAMGRARADRAGLGDEAETSTLDSLMLRYETYDSAVSELYTFLNTGHRHRGARFTTLQGRVTATQAALPDGWGVFSTIVGEVAGTPLSGVLAQITQARADIDTTLNPPLRHAQ